MNLETTMDRTRPVYGHHKSPSTAAAPPSSQGGFSAINHRRSGSAAAGISNARRPQNTKTPAQRLAQVMSNQSNDDDEDDLMYDYAPPVNSSAGIGLAGDRPVRSRSPMVTISSN